MAVKITGETTVEERTRRIEISVEDAPILQKRYTPTQRIKPDGAWITVGRKGESPWQLSKVKVFGPRVLTNGREGSGLSEEFTYNYEEAPDWLSQIVADRLNQLNQGKV